MLVVAALGIVVALGVGGLALWRAPGVAPTPPPAAPALAPADAGTPRLVLIQFLVSPADAPYAISVDGRRLETPELETPASRPRKLDIKVQAPGYQPLSIQTTPASDMAVPLNLVKLADPAAKAEAARRPAKGAAKPARPDGASAPPAAAPVKGPKLELIDKL